MSTGFEKLFKTDEEIKQDIISDFANEFLYEVKKLADMHGKEEFLRMIKSVKWNLIFKTIGTYTKWGIGALFSIY